MSGAGPAARPADPVRGGGSVGFWVAAAVGWTVMAVALTGALLDHVDTRPPSLARFLLGGALVHDLVVAPVVIAGGALVARWVRPRSRAAVQAALIVSGSLALFSFPLVRGYGRAAGNPTSVPHDYGRNLLVVVALVWAIAGATALVRGRRAGVGVRGRPGTRPPARRRGPSGSR